MPGQSRGTRDSSGVAINKSLTLSTCKLQMNNLENQQNARRATKFH